MSGRISDTEYQRESFEIFMHELESMHQTLDKNDTISLIESAKHIYETEGQNALINHVREADLATIEEALKTSRYFRALLSYYQKGFTKPIIRLLDQKKSDEGKPLEKKTPATDPKAILQLIDTVARQVRETITDTELPLGLEQQYSPEDLHIIMEHVKVIQLSHGCSKGCPKCGFDALPGVREHFSFRQLENLFNQYGDTFGKNEPYLYYASEPGDYRDGEKTYMDVHRLALPYYRPHVTTRHNGKDKTFLRFIDENADKPRLSTNGTVRGFDTDETIDWDHVSQEFFNMGFYFRDERSLTNGIACRTGIILTPRGLFSAISSGNQLNERMPQGHIVAPFEGLDDRELKAGEQLHQHISTTIFEKKEHGSALSNACWVTLSKDDEEIQIRALDRGNMTAIKKDALYLLDYDEEGIIKKVVKITPEQRKWVCTEILADEVRALLSRYQSYPFLSSGKIKKVNIDGTAESFINNNHLVSIRIIFEESSNPRSIELLYDPMTNKLIEEKTGRELNI